jgi:hypothetical protein
MPSRFAIDTEHSALRPVVEVVTIAQRLFEERLAAILARGGLTLDDYVRYLTFQYHLTKDVQRAFLTVASHASLSGRRRLREFLFAFALEEEPHYEIARQDLEALGRAPLPCPLDVTLWWAHFNEVIPRQPFRRLGATCVLENLGAGGGAVAKALLAGAPFVRPDNSRFLQIHFHEALPHGDQIYHALDAVELSAAEIRDLRVGAAEGAVMYLRMAEWALGTDAVQRAFDHVLVASSGRDALGMRA